LLYLSLLEICMEKNSRIYVAGHQGLVGSAILRRLKLEGCLDLITRTHRELDLLRQKDVEEFLESEKPEYVFLAAARVGGIFANQTKPAEFIYDNLMIQNNVIHASHKSRIKKLLFLGSSCIYPRECPQPIKEEYLLSGRLEPTNEPYAIAKIAGIKMCQSYNRQYGTNFVSVMPTNLYGPGDNFDLETSHVLPALIRKFHEAKIRSEDRVKAESVRVEANSRSVERRGGAAVADASCVTVWGSGTPRREFLFVDDLADACLFIMNHYNGSDVINVGAGRDISISELADMIKEVVGFSGGIQYDTSKPDGTPRKLLDVSWLKSQGWESKITLREGIRKTYEWYLNNQFDT
jgi:GDP-L-fucose synthase